MDPTDYRHLSRDKLQAYKGKMGHCSVYRRSQKYRKKWIKFEFVIIQNLNDRNFSKNASKTFF